MKFFYNLGPVIRWWCLCIADLFLFIDRKITAGHDISDGGFVTCVLEMAFAGNCGLDLNIDHFGKGR